MPGLDVDAGVVDASFYRHIPHDADPLWQPADPADGRWQHGAVIEGWYFADTPETAWAEWYRALAELAIPPARMLPRDLWHWSISLDPVALLDTSERLERVGLTVPQPTQSQWTRYQDVGEACYRAGYRALRVIAAARPASCNLVVFRDARELPGCTPIPPPTVTVSAPLVPRGLRT